MKRVRRLAAALRQLLGEIGSHGTKLAYLRARYSHFHEIAADEHDKAVALEARSHEEEPHPKKAARLDRKAQLHHRRSRNASAKARPFVGKIKAQNQILHGLERDAHEIEARLKKAKLDAGGVKVKGKKVVGGPAGKEGAEKRLQIALLTAARRCAEHQRRNFYSMYGTWTVEYALTSGEPFGARSDCSQFGTSIYWACGLPDLNGNGYHGGFTGTQVSNGRQVSEAYARQHPGTAIIFGPGDGHHVEYSIGDGTDHTVGHGSAPVDLGVFHLLPGEIRYFAYDLT